MKIKKRKQKEILNFNYKKYKKKEQNKNKRGMKWQRRNFNSQWNKHQYLDNYTSILIKWVKILILEQEHKNKLDNRQNFLNKTKMPMD